MQNIKTIFEECNVEFGKMIRNRREELGLTQIELSEKVGIPQSLLSYIERAERPVDLQVAMPICRVLGLTLGEFEEKFL